MPQKLCLMVHGDTFEKLQAMVGLVSTAVQMGKEAHVYLTFGALHHYVNDAMDDAKLEIQPAEVAKLYQRAVDRGMIPELHEMLDAVREKGTVRMYACSTSVKVLQLTPPQLQKCDAVMGHQSFLAIAEGQQLLFI